MAVLTYNGARRDPCLHAVRRTLLAPGQQAHDSDLLHDIGKRRTRARAVESPDNIHNLLRDISLGRNSLGVGCGIRPKALR